MLRTFDRPLPLALLLAATAVAPAARAGLGEQADSVARDQAALHGRATVVTPMQSYDLHETTTANGSRIHQYVSRTGTVFAVTFSGRTMPDLHALLGTRYPDYVAAVNSRHTNHKVLSIQTPDLVLSVLKLPRGFTGSAHVPALVPQGVSAQELR